MTDIPNFQNATDEDTYTTIFTNKLNDYVRFMTAVKGKFLPNYEWDQITAESFTVIRDITNSLLYDTTDEFEKQNPLYKREDSVFVPRKELLDAVKEAMKGTMLEQDRDSNFPGESTILGDK